MGGEAAIASERARVLIACIDSMSLSFAQEHLDSLPVLRSMIAEGALVELESPAKYVSACVWPTFASGSDPGVHGHYYPFQWDPERMRFRRTSKPEWSERLALEPFWDRLARAGIESTVLDAGYVLVNGHAPCRRITNWSYQSSGAASSSDPVLLREIRRRFGHRPIGAEVPVPKTLRQSRRIRRDLRSAVRCKTDAALWLMERGDWRFFLVGFYELHRAGHNLLRAEGDFGSEVDSDALLDIYAETDHQLGRIIERAADRSTTIIACALHGMKPNRAQDHFLPEIMARLNARYLEMLGTPPAQGEHGNLFFSLRKQVPYVLQDGLTRFLGEDIQDWVVNRTLVGGLRWSSTLAFRVLSGGEGYVRLSIKSREKRGFFEPDSEALRAYRRWLEERLLEIRVVSSGEPLIAAVHQACDLFPGPRSDLLPDLILEWAPDAPAERIHSPIIGEIRERLTTGRGGNHDGESFMVVIGPGARSPARGDVRHIRDIARFVELQLGFSSAA